MNHGYRGRFAPSPTGPLHAGSLVAALASWLDARAHGGAWLVRIEDIDPPREVAGAGESILATLAAFGLVPDEPVAWQSRHAPAFEAALSRLADAGLLYGCTCSRRTADADSRAAGLPPGVYAGTCRGQTWEPGLAARIRVPAEPIAFVDRRAGRFEQSLAREVGDFVLRRADGLWAYQLAVVVDDADAGVTDVVRGADLLDNTPRQIFLQRSLGLPTPRYLHVAVVNGPDGAKLSKQNGAPALAPSGRLEDLLAAWSHLGFAPPPRAAGIDRDAFLRYAVSAWHRHWPA